MLLFGICPTLWTGALWPMPAWVWRDLLPLFHNHSRYSNAVLTFPTAAPHPPSQTVTLSVLPLFPCFPLPHPLPVLAAPLVAAVCLWRHSQPCPVIQIGGLASETCTQGRCGHGMMSVVRHDDACVSLFMLEMGAVTNACLGMACWTIDLCSAHVFEKKENKNRSDITPDPGGNRPQRPCAQGRTFAKQDQPQASAPGQNRTQCGGGATAHGLRTRRAGKSVPTQTHPGNGVCTPQNQHRNIPANVRFVLFGVYL